MTDPEPQAAPETPTEAPEPSSDEEQGASPPEPEAAQERPSRETEVPVVVKAGAGSATVGEFAGSIVNVEVRVGDATVAPAKWEVAHVVTGTAEVAFSGAKGVDGDATLVLTIVD